MPYRRLFNLDDDPGRTRCPRGIRRTTVTREFAGVRPRADHILDLRGIIPPVTLLKISHAFREMRLDQTLEIWCSDPDTPNDILKILPPLSFEVLLTEKTVQGSVFRFQMKKKQTP